MIASLITFFLGLASGFLYSKFFIKRYSFVAEHQVSLLEDKIPSLYGKRFVTSQAIASLARHFLLAVFMIILFLYFKGNLMVWSVGFLLAFWYGVLNAANLHRKIE